MGLRPEQIAEVRQIMRTQGHDAGIARVNEMMRAEGISETDIDRTSRMADFASAADLLGEGLHIRAAAEVAARVLDLDMERLFGGGRQEKFDRVCEVSRLKMRACAPDGLLFNSDDEIDQYAMRRHHDVEELRMMIEGINTLASISGCGCKVCPSCAGVTASGALTSGFARVPF